MNTFLNRAATYMSLHGISWELIAKRGIGHEEGPGGIAFFEFVFRYMIAGIS